MTQTASEQSYDIALFSGATLQGRLSHAGRLRKGAIPTALRVVILWVVTWLPLLIIAAVEGNAYGDGVELPYLQDFRVHIQFLLVVPLFLLSDIVIEPRLNQIVRQFIDTGLVGEPDRARFGQIVERSRKLARSYLPDVVILAIVVVFIALGVRREQPLDITTWIATPTNGAATLTGAGWWLSYFGIPLYQFLVLSCLWRFVLWIHFLWQVSRLDLQLNPTHPDRTGGLAFVGVGQAMFAYFVAGFAVLYAGVMGNEIVYNDAALTSYARQIAALTVGVLVVFLSPLLVFTPKLIAAKFDGYLRHEALNSDYVRAFDRKWLRDRPVDMAQNLGSEEFQAIGSLSATFENVKRMRLVPVDLFAVLWFVAATVVPMLPLLLTVYTPEQILKLIRGFLL